LRGADDDLADKVLRARLKDASLAKVDAIVTVCSLCHLQHDMGQKIVAKKYNEDDLDIPVLHYPQVLALAFGIDPSEIGLDLHTIKTTSFLEKFTGGGV
ncbi:MAG: CoB--CoM heterodisulfide reductase subunit B, partial [Candidatus Thorarchaeota archaeon]